MNPLAYAAKVMVCSALLFGYYYLFLRNQKFHQYNRFYLLACVACSILLPLFRIPVWYNSSEASGAWIQSLSAVSVSSWEDAFIVTARTGTVSYLFNTINIAWMIYITGFVVCTIPLLRSWLYIRKLSRIYHNETLNGISFYNTREPGTPFSYFQSLFWNHEIPLTSEQGRYILQHELFHIRAKHSYDVIFIQIISNLLWFNPFFYLLLKELKTIHEFLADEYAGTTNKYDYAELLVTQALQGKNLSVSHQFFHHQIKRRIAMIIQQQPSNMSYLSRMMTLPILFALFSAFTLQVSCSDKTIEPSGPSTADAATSRLKAGTGIIPASEFISIMKSHKQEKVFELRSDSSNNLLTAKFQNGESIVTRLDEFKKLNPENQDNRSGTGNPIFTKVETEASFPGGQQAYMRFLSKNFQYPIKAQEQEIQGTVIVQFIVDKEGDVSDVQAISGPEAGGLKEEAVRVIKVSGKWTPAMQNGHTVASYKKQPIIFRLDPA